MRERDTFGCAPVPAADSRAAEVRSAVPRGRRASDVELADVAGRSRVRGHAVLPGSRVDRSSVRQSSSSRCDRSEKLPMEAASSFSLSAQTQAYFGSIFKVSKHT